jgi:quinol monooxygenase YgiN
MGALRRTYDGESDMTIMRHYFMTAKAGMEDDLERALLDLMPIVRPLDGCEGLELLRDQKDSRRFAFLERWASVEAHKKVAVTLPREAFAPMLAAIDGAPDGSYLDYISVN